ncbi:radical SAM peptide maturase, CXXX-repeat target family [Vallitalea maricola]|uniref:Uncharacterized protein n=1 Tax=Vallitalea maricola TaxID=3074433 RepID=A0ACB5UNY2_9FIRM|nr:hypothetical protein AN2V17_35640 [Vallitalea sp. AN17-2]
MIQKYLPNYQDAFHQMYPEKCGTDIAVKVITFVVTEQCNLRCTYCYEYKKNEDRPMTKDIARQTIDTLFNEDMKGNNISGTNAQAIVLDFIGGEPLLEIELMEYIVDYFRYKALKLNHRWALHHMISISTNGTLYFEPDVQAFIKKYQERLSLSITIDGNKELHDKCRLFPNGAGSYDIVEKAFLAELKRFPYASTKLTLAPENISYLKEAILHLFSIGVISIFSNCIFEEGWNVSHAKIFYHELKELADYMISTKLYTKHTCTLFDPDIGYAMSPEDNQNWCGGTGKMLAIDGEGIIYPCLRYMKFCLEKEEPITIGDIVSGIGESEEQKKNLECLKCITRRSQSTDECFNCPIATGCAWCSAYNYDKFGTANKRATYICIMHKARVLANVYYWNKLYRNEGLEERFPVNVPKEWALEIISEEEYNMLLNLSKETEGGN